MSLLKLAHQYIENELCLGDRAIDATVGNGHDTLFLAKQVGNTGRVYGFDIQRAAIVATTALVQHSQLLNHVTLIQASHADMATHIPISQQGKITACMFNLGYLPKGDKRIITQTSSTLLALTAACQLLAPQGIMTILAYPGHVGGDVETARVSEWSEQLDSKQFAVSTQFSATPSPSAPRLLVVRKLCGDES
ncbi:MAG: methyltransferase domain-containing protein [Methylococcaceae bacterium]|nr:methyltransferase domain-containing protein [Methylococcaceae bacterium]MDD1616037.1 methyltransferase domain-containing protein [Methylococcaceae bacterium]OYV18765.1 MAG: rRNA methylase [Methylococcaceae bacterium NSP1-2]